MALFGIFLHIAIFFFFHLFPYFPGTWRLWLQCTCIDEHMPNTKLYQRETVHCSVQPRSIDARAHGLPIDPLEMNVEPSFEGS